MNDSTRRELPLLAVLGAMFVASAWAWAQVPERIPVHWNAAGEVDRFGGRAEALLSLPLAASGLHLLLRFLPRIDPGAENYRSFERSYWTFRIAFLSFLAGVHGVLIAVALGARVEVLQLVWIGVGLLLVVIGAISGKVRPNWFIGIRTPWTLSSKRAWDRANRLSGWLHVAAGLAIVAIALLRPGAAVGAILLGAIAPSVVAAGYSWWVWRRDPERLPPAGTRPA